MRSEPFFSRVKLRTDELDRKEYPLRVPAVRQIENIRFHPAVTVFVGENGSGKSTLIEALAIAAGFNAEGGRKSFRTDHEATDTRLGDSLTLVRNPDREQDGFFLRSESTYLLMTYLREINHHGGYGGDLHKMSHGESFMSIFYNRFKMAKNGLFILDEIESALSPQRQLEFLMLMHEHVERGSQFIVSTHSPILMSYPHSRLYWLDGTGIEERDWRDTDHAKLYTTFLNRPEAFHRGFGKSG